MKLTGDTDFDELLEKVFRIMKTKAVDYAEPGDRLAEIRHTSEKYDIPMRKVLAVYKEKHLRSLVKWLKGEDLKGEPVEEKLLDLIVYSLLAYKLAKEERSLTEEKLAEPSSHEQCPDICYDHRDFVGPGDTGGFGGEDPPRSHRDDHSLKRHTRPPNLYTD